VELREKNLAVALIVPAKINIIKALNTGIEKPARLATPTARPTASILRLFKLIFW
jgi:hypothetical protein